jgi:putative ABC transport system permease protein
VFDDVVGVGQSGGFKGHLRALARGELSSGMVKLLGGAALGIVVAGEVHGMGGAELIRPLDEAADGLVAQYQGFADVQMGIGMVVWGMASVFLGAALVGPVRLGGALVATVAGSVTFRLLVASALRAGLHPDWLKAATALVVLAALVAPRLLTRRPQASAAR